MLTHDSGYCKAAAAHPKTKTEPARMRLESNFRGGLKLPYDIKTVSKLALGFP